MATALALTVAACNNAPEVARVRPMPVGTIPAPVDIRISMIALDGAADEATSVPTEVLDPPVQAREAVERVVEPTTPVPDVRPEPTVTAASQPPSVDWLSDVLEAAGWPEALWAEAKAIMWCESSWNPQAVSRTGDYGIWQINARTWSAFFGEPPEAWFDPVIASRRALVIYQRAGGWSPWTCSR